VGIRRPARGLAQSRADDTDRRDHDDRNDRISDSRSFVVASGAVALAFGIGTAMQTVYIFAWVAPGGSRGMLFERITANVVGIGGAVLLLGFLLMTHWGPSLHEWWRPRVLALTFAVSCVAGLVRVGLQLLLGVYRSPTVDVVLVEFGASVATLMVCGAFGFAVSAARRRTRHEEREQTAQRRAADLALQALQGEELRVKSEVAEGLHGTVQQRLVFIAASLDELAKRVHAGEQLSEEDIRSVESRVDELRERDVRATSRLLSPPLLEVGVAPSIRAILQRLPTSIVTKFDVSREFRTLDDPADNAIGLSQRSLLVRSLEEGITNALKHGAADSIRVSLSVVDDAEPAGKRIVLTVFDNGVGIADDPSIDGGLLSLSRRIQAFQGDMKIGPGNEGGTALRVSLPAPHLSRNEPEKDPAPPPQ
jgi:two-component system NarL family sensor kinase